MDDLPLWIVEAGHPAVPNNNSMSEDNGPQSCTVFEHQRLTTVSKVLIANILNQRLWSIYDQSQKRRTDLEEIPFPTILKYIQSLLKSHDHGENFVFNDKQVVVEGELVATLYTLRARKQSNDDAAEDSDDDSDAESGDGPITGELTMSILSIVDGDGEPHWYHYIIRSQILKDPLPFFDKEKTCLLWPQEKSSVLVVDISTWRTSTITFPDNTYKKHRLIAQGKVQYWLFYSDVGAKHISVHHFSPRSGALHQASIYVNNTRFITITQSFYNFTYTAADPSTARFTTSHPTQETTWRAPRTGFNLDCPFAWLEDTLYLALGSFEITILRFPPPSALSRDVTSLPILPQRTKAETPIQSLPKPICIPATAPSRDLRFFVRLDTSTSRSHAIFCLNAMPVLELPPVIMDFDMGKLCGPWEEYSVSSEDRIAASKTDMEFMKGMYAVKDQAFSVPIRSGLEWRKSTYVTCW